MDNLPIPIFSNLLIYKSYQGFSVELCLTEPYCPNGEVPLVFVMCGFIEFIVESKWLYRKIYERRFRC